MFSKLKAMITNEDAQGMTEYILIVALIALAAIVGMRFFGSKISALFQQKAEEIGAAASATPER